MSSNFDLDFNNNVENFEVEFGEVTRLTESDFNQLENRPSYNGNVMTGETNIPAVPTRTSALQNDSDYQTGSEVQTAIETAIAGKQDILTPGTGIDISNNTISIDPTVVATQQNLATEVTNRENADNALQSQIDAISASSDVVDIVGTYAELQNYDTSGLGDNDIIKVLQDSTQNNATTYYRWSTSTDTFTLIGQEGPYYTKAAADAQFVPQTRTVNGKALSSNITLNASDVSALSPSDVDTQLANSTNPVQNKVLYGLLGDMPSDFFSGDASDTQTGTDITIGEAIGLTDLKMFGDTSQNGTPTPDTPISIDVVTGVQVLTTSTVNLLDTANPYKDNYYISQNGVEGSASGFAIYGNLASAPNTTYSLSCAGATSATTLRIHIYNSEGVWQEQISALSAPANTYAETQFTTPNYPCLIRISASKSLVGLKLEYGSSVVSSATYTIDLGSIELCKIGDYQDYIYKSGGDWYVHKETGKAIYDGTETWAYQSTSAYPFRIDVSEARAFTTSDDTPSKLFTNYYIPVAWNDSQRPNYCVAATTNSIRLCFRNTDITSLANWKTWLGSNNTTVYYAIATPTDTKITDQTLIDGLNSALNMTCYDGGTNIVVTSTNLPGELEITAANKTLGGIIALLRGRS